MTPAHPYPVEPTRELAQETWAEYFDAVSRELLNAQVLIEIIDAPDRTQRGDEPLALRGLNYDGRDDVLELAAARRPPHVPSLRRHLIDHPERVCVDTRTVLPPMTITIDGQDGVRTVLTIKDEPAVVSD